MYHPLHTLQYTFVARATGFSCTPASPVPGPGTVVMNNSCPHNR